MSLSSLNRQTLRTVVMTAFVIATAACSDQSITSSVKTVTPPAPPVNASQAGMLRGTVREDGTVVLESLDPSIQVGDGNASGAIYGNQNVTAKVTASNFSVVPSGNTKTWKFTLAVHNLLKYPVGSIDPSSTPYDTIGVFVFFPTAPSVVSPANCGCAVTVQGTQGSANFSGINQQYYWYADRLAASGQQGDSTTHNPTWTFTAPSTVNSFRFTVLLSTPWPRGQQTQDTSWSVAYNPTYDSLPDVGASPRWKRVVGFSGAYSSAAATGLTLNLSNSQGDNVFFYRSDAIVRSENDYMESRLSMPTAGGNDPVMIMALIDNAKFVALGIGSGKVGFATYSTTFNKWQFIGATTPVTTTVAHTYRLGKFGATNATFYVDGVEKLSAANSVLPDNFVNLYAGFLGAQGSNMSTFFGASAQDADAKVLISYVNYAFHATPKPS